MEIVASIGSFSTWLFDVAGVQPDYLFHYHDNIETLEKEAKKLAGTRDRVRGRIEIAESNLEIIETDVQNWMADVDKITAGAEDFLEEVKANNRCLGGYCINPRKRYRLSKEAKEKALAISQLQDDGKFESVSRPAPPPEVISSSKGFSDAFKSRESLMKQVMEALKCDSVSMIGICGLGGVGKTTLVKAIAKKAKEEKLYDTIVMAVVSQNPNIVKIQEECAHILGFKLPDFNAENGRARSLWERAKKEKRMLVILDDVWERIELDQIGIPFGNDHRGCKIVLTSRSKDICDRMDAQKIFEVETLSDQDSWILFRETASLDVGDSNLNQIGREVAAECGGLPIALVTLARALKYKDKRVWSDALRQLKNSSPTNIKGMDKHVISSLELSYNYLESEEAKSMFLFCCLFPEDFEIPIEDLITYGMALSWFKDIEKIEEVRDRAHTVVSDLTSSFLLIRCERTFDYQKCVKMHDVVRDVALTIAPKYNNIFMAKAGMGLQEWPSSSVTFEDVTCISLMSNKIHEVPDRLECPKVQAVLLQGNDELVIPDNFFQGMKGLKLLDLSGRFGGRFGLFTLPKSLSLLENLRTLYLKGCRSREYSVIGKLSKLEVLSLSFSRIGEIPASFRQLIHLRLLDLNDCTELRTIPYGVISSFRKLEELYMDSFSDWDFESEGDSRRKAKFVELDALYGLRTLVISLSEHNMLPNLLLFQNSKSFTIKINVRFDPYRLRKIIHNLGFSRNMFLYHLRISQVSDWIKSLLKRIEVLYLVAIDDFLIFDDLLSLEETFENDDFEDQGKRMVPWKKDHIKTFPNWGNLTVIKIWCCQNLKSLFTPSTVKSLVQLRELSLHLCFTIQEIIKKEEEEQEASTNKIVFPSLSYINLSSLDNLTCFWSGSCTIEFPALEKLQINGCSRMEIFSYGDQVTPKLNSVNYGFCDEYWQGNLNDTVRYLFDNKYNRNDNLSSRLIGLGGLGGLGVEEVQKPCNEAKEFQSLNSQGQTT